ncbi:MAG: ATP-binding protein, partial [Pseudomonadota bacterium]
CMVVWSAEVFGLYFFSDEHFTEVWANVLRTGLIFIPYTVFHWFLTLTKDESKPRRILLYAGYILGIMFSLVNWTPYFVVPGLGKYRWGYYPQTGPLYLPFMLTFFFFTFYGLYLVYKKSRTTRSHVERNRLRYILLGASGAILVGSFNFLPMFGVDVYPIGNLANVFYVATTATAVVKHNLMDINIFVKKSLTYSFLIFLLSIPLFLIANFGQKFFFDSISYSFSLVIFGLFVIATFVLPRVKPQAEKTIEQILFRGKYDYKDRLRELSKAMISIVEREPLLAKLMNGTTETMGVESASILLLDQEKGIYCLQSSMGLDEVDEEKFGLMSDDPLVRWLRDRRKAIVGEELERISHRRGIPAIIGRLHDMESEVCIPLITRQKLIGLFNMGKKMNGTMFSHEDLDLLETLGNQAAIAVENARLYEDLKKSEARMRRADRLAALGTLTAGLAHEIRNPLVAIKTFTQLLPERFDDAEFRDHFLKVTSGEVDRICSLVNELLEFSRPSEPNLAEEDINDVAEKMLLLIENEAKKKTIKMSREYGKDMPPVMIDKEQIKQVLLNLLLNAVDATPENGTISLETRLLRNDYSDYVQMEVRDTGTGIPKDDLEHIFTPFFTTKHGGSGLGLPVSYRIVQEHRGYIEVESTVGEGSSFYVILPLAPLVAKRGKRWQKI